MRDYILLSAGKRREHTCLVHFLKYSNRWKCPTFESTAIVVTVLWLPHMLLILHHGGVTVRQLRSCTHTTQLNPHSHSHQVTVLYSHRNLAAKVEGERGQNWQICYYIGLPGAWIQKVEWQARAVGKERVQFNILKNLQLTEPVPGMNIALCQMVPEILVTLKESCAVYSPLSHHIPGLEFYVIYAICNLVEYNCLVDSLIPPRSGMQLGYWKRQHTSVINGEQITKITG